MVKKFLTGTSTNSMGTPAEAAMSSMIVRTGRPTSGSPSHMGKLRISVSTAQSAELAPNPPFQRSELGSYRRRRQSTSAIQKATAIKVDPSGVIIGTKYDGQTYSNSSPP